MNRFKYVCLLSALTCFGASASLLGQNSDVIIVEDTPDTLAHMLAADLSGASARAGNALTTRALPETFAYDFSVSGAGGSLHLSQPFPAPEGITRFIFNRVDSSPVTSADVHAMLLGAPDSAVMELTVALDSGNPNDSRMVFYTGSAPGGGHSMRVFTEHPGRNLHFFIQSASLGTVPATAPFLERFVAVDNSGALPIYYELLRVADTPDINGRSGGEENGFAAFLFVHSSVIPVPEPAALSWVALALLLGFLAWKRKR